MTAQKAAFIGIASALLFWSALLVIAGLDPSYSHAVRAVSELGMIGAPHKWTWNVAGFMLPGLLIALFGIGLAGILPQPGRAGAFLLCLSGLCFAATGIFPADLADMRSFTTQAHIWTSFASLLVWLPVPILIAIAARRRSMNTMMWASLLGLSAALAGLVLGQVFLSRGFAQRLNFATYFAWVLAIAVLLIRAASSQQSTAREQSVP